MRCRACASSTTGRPAASCATIAASLIAPVYPDLVPAALPSLDPWRDCRRVRLYAALFAIGLAGYGLAAWDRLGRSSAAPHFVYQADAWLHGSTAISPPLTGDDWAKGETVALDD